MDGFAFTYRLNSTLGNQLYIYELVFAILFLITSLATSIASLYGASNVWEAVEAREAGAKANGQFGSAVSVMDALKFGALGGVVAMGTWIAAYSMGQTVDELIGWFDEWSDPSSNDAPKEGDDKDDSDNVDPDGTSIRYDFMYHAITIVYTWVTFTAIMVGGQYFFLNFFQFKDAQDCDLSQVDVSTYKDVATQIASITDLATCKAVKKKLFMLADLNKDNAISRCENAKFLFGIGNTQEYALSYSMIETLPDMYHTCSQDF